MLKKFNKSKFEVSFVIVSAIISVFILVQSSLKSESLETPKISKAVQPDTSTETDKVISSCLDIIADIKKTSLFAISYEKIGNLNPVENAALPIDGENVSGANDGYDNGTLAEPVGNTGSIHSGGNSDDDSGSSSTATGGSSTGGGSATGGSGSSGSGGSAGGGSKSSGGGSAISSAGSGGTPRSFNVDDVYIQGDSTIMGMKITSSHFADGAFLVETTGARFEYIKGQLKLYQGLDEANRRLLSTITFDNEPNFTKVEDNNDHILFWSKDLNIGIYGDSTLIISPKVNQSLKCKGNFKPDYEGRYKGELLLIDDKGGMEIYPQRYEKGYEIKNIELGQIYWRADYSLNVGERVMIAAFPGKPFDWEKSFRCNVVITSGSGGLGIGDPEGQMTPDLTLRRWANNFHIISVFFNGFYKNSSINGEENPAGPYIVANEPEFRRFLNTAHTTGMKVTVYCSLYSYTLKNHNNAKFYDEINELKNKFGIDGVYIDGLTFDAGGPIDNKIGNWEMIRRFRQLFGTEGVLVYHGTSLGSPVATVPNIDSYCDATFNGENVAFKSVNDPYIKYQVKKYGISNTVALWKQGKHPASITYKDIAEATIQMNGRERWESGAMAPKPPQKHFWWIAEVGPEYRYYLDLLEENKRLYLNKSNQ